METVAEAEAGAHGADLFGIAHTADEGRTAGGGEPSHAHVVGQQAVPDLPQAGGKPEAGVLVVGESGNLGVPRRVPCGLAGAAPVGGVEFGPSPTES